jgi:outer membrane protein assembly factor BamC
VLQASWCKAIVLHILKDKSVNIRVNTRLTKPFKLPNVLLSSSILAAFLISGCGVLEEDKINYRSVGKGTSLEVPPDLVQLSRDNRYNIPGGPATASGFEAGKTAGPVTGTAPIVIGDVKIERAGNQRWLVINRTPEKLWPQLRDFWTENGFLLTTDDQNIGILETDWAENRAKLPQDAIRSLLGKVFDSLYSTGERDKFRTRVERNPNGSTEIFVSHRGMIEKYTTASKDGTVWTPRDADPELEAEFLRRMMVKMGVTEEQSKRVVATAPAQQTSKIVSQNGQNVIQIDEAFDRAWRRVGLALDRTGFTVEDRDRANGVYFVRYVALNPDKKEPGFLSKIFSSEANVPVLKYRIAVKSGNATQTIVSVLNDKGAAATGADVQNILKVLADDLK